MITLEYSSICFNPDNYQAKLDEARKWLADYPVRLGVQIHNSISADMLDRLKPYRNELPFTIHSPILSEHFINLCLPEWDIIRQQAESCMTHLREFDTRLFFFHGFFLSPRIMRQDMQHYRKTIAAQISPQYSFNRSFIMNPECFETDEYRAYKTQFRKNLEQLQSGFPDYEIALENDFVGIGSGFQRPQELLETPVALWFDLGHFWCASLLHRFDFYEMADELIHHKTIPGVHLNHNLMTRDHPWEGLMDSHTHLYTPSQQNLKPLIRKMVKAKIERFTLEIVNGDIQDLKILVDWIS